MRHVNLVNLTPGQKLLDVGCGTGATLRLLGEKYGKSVELYGIEPSEDMLWQAQTRLHDGKAHLKQGVAQKLPYPDGHFDIVISTQVLHHLPTPEKKKMLLEMHRVLKPGGTIVLSDWGKPTNTLGKCISFLWRKHAFVKENSPMLEVDAFQKRGFKNTKEQVQFGIVHHISATK